MAVSTTVQIKAEDKTKAAFRKINDRTSKLKKSFGGLAGAAAGLAGAIGIGALMSSMKDLGDRIGKVSVQIGISTSNLQKLQFAAEQSGLSTDTMTAAMQKFAINIGKANDGAKIQAEAFQSLDIETKNLDGTTKSIFEIFKETSEGLGNLTDKTLQARLASELFGRTGVEMTVLFDEGAKGIDKYGKQLDDVNGIIGNDSIVAIQRFNDSWNLMTKIVRGFLLDSKTLNLLSDIIDGWNFGIIEINKKFGDQEKKIRDINTISDELKLTRKETALYQSQIEKSTGEEKKEAQERLKTNKEQIKELQTELLSSEKIEGSIKDQEKAQTKVKKAIKATDTVAKELKKTVKPLMIAGKLDIPAIGGRQGLGGSLEKFTEFYLNLMVLAEDYLGTGFGTAGIVKKHLKTIRQDFTEMITGLQNQLVFRRNDISDAFADILTDFEKELQETKIDVENINIEIPSSAFDFTNTFAKVPGEIFDFSAVIQSAGAVDSLVKQINSYSVGSRSVSRRAVASTSHRGHGTVVYGEGTPTPYWLGDQPKGDLTLGMNDLKYDVPSISSSGTSSRSSGRSSMSSGSSALESTGGNTPIQVNIYDGTGQKISAYDSAIRVEINERASRFNEFSAMAA